MTRPFVPPAEPWVRVPTREGYDRWSMIYDEEDNALIALERRHFPDLLGSVAGLAVLDVGGGTGRHAIALTKQGARVTLADFSEKMMAKAVQKPEAAAIGFIRQDFSHDLALKSACFDRVICCLVLDHIVDLPHLMAEMKRVCRPDGFIAISIMHPAMNLVGVQARFTDPDGGDKIFPHSMTHTISNYVMAAVSAGLTLADLQEYSVDDELVKVSERARKHLGWPLLLLMKLKP